MRLNLFVLGALSFSFVVQAEEVVAPKVWKNEAEAGAVIAKGNSEGKTVNLKNKTDVTLGNYVLGIKGSYLRSSSFGVESARQWNLGVRAEKALSPVFSGYLAQTVEGNRYTNIAQRYSSDIGGKYTFIKTEPFVWFAELGYRFTKENRLSGESINYSSGRIYTETERKWTPTFSTKYWIEYLPNISNWVDYQINSEISVSAAINSIFSLKNGYLVRYDNLPAGTFKKTDTIYTAALVAKF